MTESEWKFSDPPNMASFTTKKIFDGEHYIDYVSHDEDDGCWQFLSSHTESYEVSNAFLVGLAEVVSIDGSLVELADLPLGWSASRSGKNQPWVRTKQD
ncbi:MAG: hypothetical protein WA793_08765 [Sphingorhabdus sp.]|uniref:hypothetical protein n=1 Tax=Sphingorhabdus sp. TaxID=1902408 RepID=UPI003CBDF21F